MPRRSFTTTRALMAAGLSASMLVLAGVVESAGPASPVLPSGSRDIAFTSTLARSPLAQPAITGTTQGRMESATIGSGTNTSISSWDFGHDASARITAPATAASATSASDIDVLVNKQNPLNPPTYEPTVVPLSSVGLRGSQEMRPEAANAMSQMVAAAKSAGIDLEVGSGYRSHAIQAALFSEYEAWRGKAEAEKFSARPGHSEHQTGLSADVNSPSEGCYLDACFGSTRAGEWVAENAWRYGFIIRYPRGYNDITGFLWEPWHVRFVGEDIAKQMREQSIPTLEQYLEAPPAPTY